jgi:hypothetical protein
MPPLQLCPSRRGAFFPSTPLPFPSTLASPLTPIPTPIYSSPQADNRTTTKKLYSVKSGKHSANVFECFSVAWASSIGFFIVWTKVCLQMEQTLATFCARDAAPAAPPPPLPSSFLHTTAGCGAPLGLAARAQRKSRA